MGLSAALASSSIGRSIVKAYMDDAARELIKSLIEFAELTEGSKTSRAFEKGTSILTLFVSFTLSSSPLLPSSSPPPFFFGVYPEHARGGGHTPRLSGTTPPHVHCGEAVLRVHSLLQSDCLFAIRRI